MRKKVSIIIPSYKPSDYLWDCLNSFYKQTFPFEHFEIVLILNGCNEPYYTKINEWLALHPELCVNFQQTDKGGVSNARNIGIDMAQGEYIGFVDDDDYVSPSYIEELYSKASFDTIPLAYAISFFDDSRDKFIPYRKTFCYEKRVAKGRQSFNPASTYFSGPVYKLIHKNVIGDRRFPTDFVNGEDTIFNFEISDRFKYVVFTDKKATYYWRRRKNSAQSNLASFDAKFSRMVRMISRFNRIYFQRFWKYNFIFYVTRVLSTIKSLFLKH